MKAQIANDRFPGAVVLVARKGKVVYFETVGLRDPATGAPMTRDAIFRLYSMTKPFTSVAAMILVEEGKLLLADPVSKYFPEFASPQVALKETTDGKTTYRLVPADRPITIQDLLRHTSGFAYASNTLNDQVKAAYGTIGVDWRDVTPTEQIQRLAQAPLAHHPGTMWEYSLSTDVLGRVVEKVSGMTLGAFLTERLFGPLKMADTAFVVPREKVARLAQPFAIDKATGRPITLLDVTVVQKNDAGGAGTAGTTGDYARFVQMLANGGQLDGARLLGRATVSYMTSDHLGTIKPAIALLQPGYGFGLGFAVRKETGVNSVPGSAGEYNWGGAAGTGFWIDPKEALICVIMTQTVPGPAQRYDRALVRQLVYQAIID
ncbi:MAG: beta-lactamase family protein [Candidatus Rokuibacteriota bacterium]|nr:MAG: beta-lactamase family protein [Candidatus Rokubacteria bacterium]